MGPCFIKLKLILVPFATFQLWTVLFVSVRTGTAYRYLFHSAGKFCENQLKACSVGVSIRQAYRHPFSKKHWLWTLFISRFIMVALCNRADHYIFAL